MTSPSHYRLRWRIIPLIAAVWCGPAVAAPAETPQPAQHLDAVGNDRVLWLIVGDWNAEADAFLHRFARMDKSSTRLRPVRIVPQKGSMQVERWAVAGDRLHAFFGRDRNFPEDGGHYSYSPSGSVRERSLPGPTMPLAVAGESEGRRPRLWAVVGPATADAVAANWAEVQKSLATQDGDDEGNGESGRTTTASAPGEGISRSAQPFHLVQYDGVYWQPGFPASSHCREAEEIWLYVADGQFHLFWQIRRTDSEVHYAWREEDRWLSGPVLALEQPPVDAFAGVVNRQVVFAALQKDRENPQQLHARIFALRTNADGTRGWQVCPPWRAGGESQTELALPLGSAVTGFLEVLAVIRPWEGRAEMALYPAVAGGAAIEDFREVPLAEGGGEPRSRQGMRELAATLIVVAILLLVFWRRQESIALPLPLPMGIEVAGPGKRVLAAVIDMLPAGLLIWAIYHESLSLYGAELRTALASYMSGNREMLEAVQTPDALAWAWVWFRLVYVTGGTLCELLWQTTPGKRLLGSRVCFETLEPPNAVQIITRNLAKLIELEPLLGIWPFVLVIFLTRNRQRVGDLLARTVVVEGQAMEPEFPVDSEDDGQRRA